MNLQQRPEKINPERIAADPLIQRLYASRLNHPNERNLVWQALLPPTFRHLKIAIKRIEEALLKQEIIVIYGDYDVDGASATALLYTVLKRLGGQVFYFIPDRQIHGYGLNEKGWEALLQEFPEIKLLITVDNGIKASAISKTIKALNIDLIITDHHLPAEELPEALAIINPQCEDFPSKALAGVGVAFYLAWGLQNELNRPDLKVSQYLDWVALGTIADIVPLDYNNRILLAYGLNLLKKGGNIGLSALAEISGVDWRYLTSTDIAFNLAPRLNAVGRMASMKTGVELLLSENYQEALRLAKYLDDCNNQRKNIEQEILQQIEITDKKLQVAYRAHWHEGVLGIVASRLKNQTGKPSMVATSGQNGWIKGSIRSPNTVSAKGLLDMGAEVLPADGIIYGGHAGAGGFSVREALFNDFISAIENQMPEVLPEIIYHDGQLSAEYLNLEWAKKLETLDIWGEQFPSPIFLGEFEIVDFKILKNQHTAFTLKQNNQIYSAVYFFKVWNHAVSKALFLYQLGVNRFRDTEKVQLMIRDSF